MVPILEGASGDNGVAFRGPLLRRGIYMEGKGDNPHNFSKKTFTVWGIAP